MAAGTYTVISPGSSSGSVNVGQGGALAPWYIDANGNFRNDSAADFTGNTIWMGPATAAGVRIARNGSGVLQTGLADLSANASLAAYKFQATNLDGSTQFSDSTSVGAAGVMQYFDGSAIAANIYSQTKRSRAVSSSKATGYTVVRGDTGTVFDNSGASASVTFTLPTATIGQQYTFCSVVAQSLVVTPQGTDTFMFGTKTAGQSLTAAAAKGAFLTIVCTSATNWSVVALSSSPAWS